jgi:hypothetical protein
MQCQSEHWSSYPNSMNPFQVWGRPGPGDLRLRNNGTTKCLASRSADQGAEVVSEPCNAGDDLQKVGCSKTLVTCNTSWHCSLRTVTSPVTGEFPVPGWQHRKQQSSTCVYVWHIARLRLCQSQVTSPPLSSLVRNGDNLHIPAAYT